MSGMSRRKSGGRRIVTAVAVGLSVTLSLSSLAMAAGGQKAGSALNMAVVGQNDLGGRGYNGDVWVHDGTAYVGHGASATGPRAATASVRRARTAASRSSTFTIRRIRLVSPRFRTQSARPRRTSPSIPRPSDRWRDATLRQWGSRSAAGRATTPPSSAGYSCSTSRIRRALSGSRSSTAAAVRVVSMSSRSSIEPTLGGPSLMPAFPPAAIPMTCRRVVSATSSGVAISGSLTSPTRPIPSKCRTGAFRTRADHGPKGRDAMQMRITDTARNQPPTARRSLSRTGTAASSSST